MHTETVQKYMTMAPKTIGFDQSLETASEYMRKLHVRHLPVLKGGQLIGIVSERDIQLVLTFATKDALSLSVEEALTPDPYFTTVDAPLADVAGVMASKKYGCALVMDGKHVVGIFTAVDALKALSSVLQNVKKNEE
jgi:acetoin utilization protein AcuB